jgi:glucokinase
MILAIDVGGTKTLLALYRQQGKENFLYKEMSYKSAEFNSIEKIISDFIGEEELLIDTVCAGVAGTIINQSCQITNLSWGVSALEIQKITGAEQVYLLNDLAATAWAVGLADMQYEEINKKTDECSGDIAILSAGTGLGEAILIDSLQGCHVLSTEGGHASFAPQNDEQDRLLIFLRQKYQGHVSYERLVSGQGLYNIYLFLQQEGKIPVDKNMTEKIKESDPAEIIGAAAVLETDALCCASVRLLCEIYAAEAGNLALKCLPRGGVVLAGGMPPKILALLKRNFMPSFVKKGRYSEYLSSLSVRVCMNEKAVLLGTLAYAQRQKK